MFFFPFFAPNFWEVVDRSMNFSLSFYGCGFSSGDTMRWWGHSGPALFRIFALRGNGTKFACAWTIWLNFHYIIFYSKTPCAFYSLVPIINFDKDKVFFFQNCYILVRYITFMCLAINKESTQKMFGWI